MFKTMTIQVFGKKMSPHLSTMNVSMCLKQNVFQIDLWV